MTAAALGGGFLELPSSRPAWLRPAAIAAVVALHAAALAYLPRFAAPSREPPREIIVDVQPEQVTPEPPPPVATEPPPAPPQPDAPPPQASETAPPPEPAPIVEAAPESAPPPPPPPEAVKAAPEPTPPPPPEIAKVEPEPQLPPAPVELQAPKARPVEPPKLKARPEPKLERQRPEPTPATRRPRLERQAKAEREEKVASLPPSREAAPARTEASAAEKSAYAAEAAAAIRSRLFYPPPARARGARGVVGVAFVIGPSGVVSSFAITRSSGDAELDAAARTLVHSAHFPPPPGGAMRVATSFDYAPR